MLNSNTMRSIKKPLDLLVLINKMCNKYLPSNTILKCLSKDIIDFHPVVMDYKYKLVSAVMQNKDINEIQNDMLVIINNILVKLKTILTAKDFVLIDDLSMPQHLLEVLIYSNSICNSTNTSSIIKKIVNNNELLTGWYELYKKNEIVNICVNLTPTNVEISFK